MSYQVAIWYETLMTGDNERDTRTAVRMSLIVPESSGLGYSMLTK